MRRSFMFTPLLLLASLLLTTTTTSAQSTTPISTSYSTRNPIPTTIPGPINGGRVCTECLVKGIAAVPSCTNVTLELGDDFASMTKDQKTCYCAISTAESYAWLQSCVRTSNAPIGSTLCPAVLVEGWVKDLGAAKTGACNGTVATPIPTPSKPGNGAELLVPLSGLFTAAAAAAVGVVAMSVML
ncbi:MAG: hypothetical protein J3R72DRAFT_450312 [Linnemannia gamsii]|nr:MAG: hypothetical protein J3R72DRAFT_450312 [Linnemannia gamsii]